MKTAKDFFERLKTDEAFAKEFAEVLKVKRESGAKNYYETMIPAAKDFGYEVNREDLDEIIAARDTELSSEELGKVAGGTMCFTWLAVASSAIMGSGIFTMSLLYEEETNKI